MIKIDDFDELYNCSEQISEVDFWVRDSDSGVCEICSKNQGQLNILNPKRKPVDFLKIDGCLISVTEPIKRCDCSLSTNEKIFFVEFKEKENFSDKRSKKVSFNKAKLQLINSINYFKRYGIDLRNTHGVIVLTPKLPHNYKQVVSTCDQFHIADVFIKSGCPNLLHGNIIEI